jgi:V8-like Glu-specific endopeptidase
MILLLASCGEARRSSGKKKTTLTQDQIQEIMDHQILTCAGISGHSCPAGISRLLTLDQLSADDSYVCSGFMVGQNTLVTNHHCISTIEQCRNTYIAIYDGSSYVQTRCKSIIEAQEDYADENDPHRKIDFAVIEIEDNYLGGTFELSATQAQVGDTITAWVIDHIGLDRPVVSDQNPYEARITEFSCQVMNQTDSDSLVLETCPIIHGNSGSPILNNSGKIVGVIWGATDAGVNSNTDLAIRRSLSGLGIATEMIYFKDYVSL